MHARLVIPTGILRILVFSSPVALFSQESQFLFLRNFLGTPSGILSVPSLLYQAYVHRNSYDPLQNHVPPKNSSGKHRKKKKIQRNPVRYAVLGPKNKFLKIGITNLECMPILISGHFHFAISCSSKKRRSYLHRNSEGMYRVFGDDLRRDDIDPPWQHQKLFRSAASGPNRSLPWIRPPGISRRRNLWRRR
jgi:hypothetical protein